MKKGHLCIHVQYICIITDHTETQYHTQYRTQYHTLTNNSSLPVTIAFITNFT